MKKNKILARILSCMLTMSFMTVMSSCGEKEDNSKQIRIIGKTPLQNPKGRCAIWQCS